MKIIIIREWDERVLNAKEQARLKDIFIKNTGASRFEFVFSKISD